MKRYTINKLLSAHYLSAPVNYMYLFLSNETVNLYGTDICSSPNRIKRYTP